ncbi:MAG: hypothetical protein ABSB30_01420, partial [Terracidiphilus sp.]
PNSQWPDKNALPGQTQHPKTPEKARPALKKDCESPLVRNAGYSRGRAALIYGKRLENETVNPG